MPHEVGICNIKATTVLLAPTGPRSPGTRHMPRLNGNSELELRFQSLLTEESACGRCVAVTNWL